MNTHWFSGTNGARLAAHLHVPSGPAGSRNPGVVVLGSWTTVKEQMATTYARRLAEGGFVALTFDFRGFGQSEGEPRDVESGHAKARDILDAAAYLATRPEVDPANVGALGVCAGALYTVLALQGAGTFGAPKLIKSVAMAAPWMHDADIVETLYGGKAAVDERLARAAAARQRFVRTGEVEYVPAASNKDQSAAMYFEGDALDYYLNPNRGAIPQWGGRFATMAWTEWLQTSSTALAAQFKLPLLIVTAEKAATPEGAKRFAAAAGGPAEVVWGPPDAQSQFHFYDDPATVRFAADRCAEHYRRTLL
jgi:alpha-beta hydrolase superfamily lysophospholipase